MTTILRRGLQADKASAQGLWRARGIWPAVPPPPLLGRRALEPAGLRLVAALGQQLAQGSNDFNNSAWRKFQNVIVEGPNTLRDPNPGVSNVNQSVFLADLSSMCLLDLEIRRTSGATVYPRAALTFQEGGTTITANVYIDTNLGAVSSSTASFAQILPTSSSDWFRLQIGLQQNGTGNANHQINIAPAASTDGFTRDDLAVGTNSFRNIFFYRVEQQNRAITRPQT